MNHTVKEGEMQDVQTVQGMLQHMYAQSCSDCVAHMLTCNIQRMQLCTCERHITQHATGLPALVAPCAMY